jgi:hypothetical protein
MTVPSLHRRCQLTFGSRLSLSRCTPVVDQGWQAESPWLASGWATNVLWVAEDRGALILWRNNRHTQADFQLY